MWSNPDLIFCMKERKDLWYGYFIENDLRDFFVSCRSWCLLDVPTAVGHESSNPSSLRERERERDEDQCNGFDDDGAAKLFPETSPADPVDALLWTHFELAEFGGWCLGPPNCFFPCPLLLLLHHSAAQHHPMWDPRTLRKVWYIPLSVVARRASTLQL